jgi:hypothetical protein
MFEFPLPWIVGDFDGRIVIVAADGARVCEVYPSQHLGTVPPPYVCNRVAQRIVEAVNHPPIKLVT